jgi:homoserine O-acetyltransferase/O-succinyltransferase
MDWPTQEGVFALGDLPLKGGLMRNAKLCWRTHGTLSPARDNVIVYPTSYSAQTPELAWLIGPDGILDPGRWFIVQPDMFGNGLSSSPSNTADYPTLVTAWDNVHAQKRLLAEVFGVERVACVYGWSMGAQQAYHWAAAFPGAVERIIAICGSAKTAVHNQVFLRGLLAVLEAAPEYLGDGRFASEPTKTLRAFARIYAGWALSQDFYRSGLHLAAEPDLESFLRNQWDVRWAARKAANLYAQAMCWHAGDISDNSLYGGNLIEALGSIEARVLLMPGETDLYFRVADNEAEMPHLRRAALRPIPSIHGHRAGNPVGNPTDIEFLRRESRAWLEA